ncbi:MAG: hypothetical protein AAF804_13435, partial [Bacteroidota bacterium]
MPSTRSLDLTLFVSRLNDGSVQGLYLSWTYRSWLARRSRNRSRALGLNFLLLCLQRQLLDLLRDGCSGSSFFAYKGFPFRKAHPLHL